jgi:hypothetical protein
MDERFSIRLTHPAQDVRSTPSWRREYPVQWVGWVGRYWGGRFRIASPHEPSAIFTDHWLRETEFFFQVLNVVIIDAQLPFERSIRNSFLAL